MNDVPVQFLTWEPLEYHPDGANVVPALFDHSLVADIKSEVSIYRVIGKLVHAAVVVLPEASDTAVTEDEVVPSPALLSV